MGRLMGRIAARGFFAASLLLAFCLPLCARAADDAFLVASDPPTSQGVYAGDAILYTITVTAQSATEQASYLRVQLGRNLQLVETSLSITAAQDAQATSDPNAAQPTAVATYPIIPGDDGFVVLPSALREGDVLSFRAVVRNDAEVTMSVQTEAHGSQHLAHRLLVIDAQAPEATIGPPTPATPLPTTQPADDAGGFTTRMAVIAFACLLLLVAFSVAYFQFGLRETLAGLLEKWQKKGE